MDAISTRKRTYHVITPLKRIENLPRLIPMLEAHQIQWEVIVDDDMLFGLTFPQDWIHVHVCPNRQSTFFLRCNWAINWYLDTHPPELEHRFCYANDDDGFEPGYFDKVDQHEGNVIITSMKRGDHIPVGVQAERAHGTHTLYAKPENMVVGGVGVEQIVMSGGVLRGVRIPMEISGDGIMINWVVLNHGAEYCSEAFALFNALEPGRWDTPPF